MEWNLQLSRADSLRNHSPYLVNQQKCVFINLSPKFAFYFLSNKADREDILR